MTFTPSLAGRVVAGLAAALIVGSAGARAEPAGPAEPISAFRALSSNKDAYCSRISLIRSATRRVDIQTYILTPDITGSGLIRELEAAASRGVAIRLLLDDYGSHEAKPRLDTLRRTPGVEIRYVNASQHRGLGRRIDYFLRFGQLNRRMHNKSFIVDDRAAIIGGRNIGDVYFRQGEVKFADLDVKVEGPVVADLTGVFDLYWNAPLAAPLDAIEPLAARPRAFQDPSPELAPRCDEGTEPPALVQSAPTLVFSDPPTKLYARPDTPHAFDPIREQIRREIGTPSTSLLVISPYFIPSDDWVEGLVALRSRGVDVRVLTNSAKATNSTPVHAAYSKYRRDLLEGGVRLFEFKPTGEPVEEPDLEFAGLRSRSTLHAKTFAVDGDRIFVGSFNFDPRSVNLNTEMGLVLRSPPAAQGVKDFLDTAARASTYELRAQEGRVVWLDTGSGEEKILKREPGLNILERALLRLLALAPIEHLL